MSSDKVTIRKSLLCVVLASAMAAGCGGGGDGGSGNGGHGNVPVDPAPTPGGSDSGSPAPDPITDLPTSSYTGAVLEMFNTLNASRIAAGVSALRQNVQLDAAADAHSRYMSANYVLTHYEEPGKPGFTGVTPSDRAAAFGYERVVGELVSVNYTAEPSNHIKWHLNTVYHLWGALRPTANEVGFGLTSGTSPAVHHVSSVSLGTTDARLKPVNVSWVWPVDGATKSPRAFIPATESPNPVSDWAPDSSIRVGAPIMFCASAGDYAKLTVTAAKLERVDGEPIPGSIRILHHPDSSVSAEGMEVYADPIMEANYPSMRSCVFLITRQPLAAATLYRVSVTATQAGEDVSRSWTFETEDQTD